MNKTKLRPIIPAYLLYHHFEANVLKGDQFPFILNKIMIKTTDQTKQ